MARIRSRSRDTDEIEDEEPIRNDAYVGLLAISFLALLVGIVFMYLDHDELSSQQVPQPTVTVSDDGLATPKSAPKQ